MFALSVVAGEWVVAKPLSSDAEASRISSSLVGGGSDKVEELGYVSSSLRSTDRALAQPMLVPFTTDHLFVIALDL